MRADRALLALPGTGGGWHARAGPLHIRSFVLEGNTLLEPDAVECIRAPHRGNNKDLADIQRALESLEAAYRKIGYGVVQVSLPVARPR